MVTLVQRVIQGRTYNRYNICLTSPLLLKKKRIGFFFFLQNNSLHLGVNMLFKH